MHYFGYVFMLFVSGIVLLEQLSYAKSVPIDENRDKLQEQTRMILKKWRKRDVEDCPKPYHVLTTDNRCVWSCGEGTTPDTASNECICQSGYYPTGTDQFERRTCSECPKPYHVLTTDNRCVWSCGEGTTPDTASNECICQSGYYPTGTDQFERRTCSECPKPYHVLTPDNRCVWSCGEGTTPDSHSNECICQKGYPEAKPDQYGRRTCSQIVLF